MFWQLFPTFFALVFASILALFLLAYRPFNQHLIHKTQESLQQRLEMARVAFQSIPKEKTLSVFKTLLSRWDLVAGVRFTLIDENGIPKYDTRYPSEKMDNHLDRPEVAQALSSGQGYYVRYSNTIHQELMYSAIALVSAKGNTYVLRAAISMEDFKAQIYSVYNKILLMGGLILGIVILLSYWLSRKVSRPLEEMKRQAQKIAEGDFSERVSLRPNDPFEVHKLAQAMNDISVQLHKRMKTILNQKNERDAILSSMVEGVLAVDPNEKIVHLNQAAANILKISKLKDVVGKNIQEAIRLPEFQEIVQSSLAKALPSERHLNLLVDGKETVLEIKSSPLSFSSKKNIGVLLVFSDVTQLRKLESHRREFVANVSHELRTPLTSVRGFAETLLGQNVNPEEQRKFLEIINHHAQRLSEIIDDLLALSKIEKNSEDNEITLVKQKIWPTLIAAKEMVTLKAKNHEVHISLEGDKNLEGNINSQLLEQALVNLVDNAIKYSPRKSIVKMGLIECDNEIQIFVEDKGPGIAKEHLPRLFERFYRIDKARSRQLGGTGLGLAIVKHVALAHHGRVQVESLLGAGSNFYIFLPK